MHAANAEESILNVDVLFNDFLELLEWGDDDPRDINDGDINEFEDLAASRLDTFLAELEKKISNKTD